MIEIERYKMNIIVVLFHSFIHFCLNDHFLSAGADIRKCWALNKCSLSDYPSGWMTCFFLQRCLLSGEESRALTNFALEADRRAVWGQHGTLLTNETGRCLLEVFWEWHFCILKRDSWNELPFFFQGLSSSLNVVSGVVSRSLVTMWGKVRRKSRHAKDGSENIEPAELIILELSYLWVSCYAR